MIEGVRGGEGAHGFDGSDGAVDGCGFEGWSGGHDGDVEEAERKDILNEGKMLVYSILLLEMRDCSKVLERERVMSRRLFTNVVE